MLPDQFISFINSNNLFQPNDHLLIAASGGVDSQVLIELCARAGFTFSLAHCNFQLRGEESVRDENFIIGVAERYKVPLHVKRFDTESFAQRQN